MTASSSWDVSRSLAGIPVTCGLPSAAAHPQPRFVVGQRVRQKATGEVGVVIESRRVGDEWQYELFMSAAESHVYFERFLSEAVDDKSVVGKLKNWDFLEPADFRQALTTLKLQRPLEQNLYSYLASRTDLQPYQFKPVVKLLQSPYGRMFIADEVGLGKTIEAGIVMLELAARVTLRRVLVVCPPALRKKWHLELLERFDQEFEILDRPRLVQIISDADAFHAPVKAIGSLALLRNADIVTLLSETETRFDLVVIDESHHMQNPETMSHRSGEQLSAIADHMLMLSATPLSLSADNLFHQLSILVPEEFFDVVDFRDRIEPNRHLNQAIRALRSRPPKTKDALSELQAISHLPQARLFIGNPFYEEIVDRLAAVDGEDEVSLDERFTLQERINDLNTIGHVFTRTRKREVQDHFPARRPAVVKVKLVDAERAFYDAVTEYVRRNAGAMANFVVIMPQRQVASSIPAAREYLRERWGVPSNVEDDTAAESDLDAEEGMEVGALDDEEWHDLVATWGAAEGVDSKYEAFIGAVREAIEEGTAAEGKILVFSFFRKTIEHLARRMRTVKIDGRPLRVSILYGPTPEDERHRIVQAFRSEPGPHVVLASEIAAEGLDFEFVNVMVNYDLPWNPMRVEQRIGRLDRYGQQAKTIHIINFSVEDTIEERILERLYARIGIFEAAIGDLESILGDEIENLTKDLLQPGLSAAEEADIIDQAAENIVRRREEDERFEKESQGLLGQDDVFAVQLGRIEKEQRYVGPDEIRNFVGVALSRRFPRIKVAQENGLARITVPPDGAVGELMSAYLQRHPERAGRKAWRAVSRASPGGEWLVTFDPETATRRRDVDFLALQHPLVGALLDDEPEIVRPVAALHVETDDLEPGRRAFFLYLLDVHSFRAGLEFLPVVVDLNAKGVDGAASPSLLKLIREAEVDPASGAEPADHEVEEAWTTAEEWLAEQIRDREAELSRISDQIIDRRISSLEESFGRWLEHRRGLLEQAEYKGQKSIARLHRGYIRRREGEVAAKLQELEGLRTVQIGHELVAGGILDIRPSR
jgi:SNF2 family DNA or RNA helicase